MRALWLLLFLLSNLIVNSASANEEYVTVGPSPIWVTPPAIPDATPAMLAKAQGGYLIRKYFGLTHSEQGMERSSYYWLSAVEVTDRSGLEAVATVQIDFDPLTDRVVLHQIAKIRDGKTLDVTNDVQPEIIRPEPDMNVGIFTGRHSAVYQIPDVRVGDLTVVAYSIESLPLLQELETWGADFRFGMNVPIVSNEMVMDLPKSVFLETEGGDHPLLKYSTEDRGTFTRHRWLAENVPPNAEEEGTPNEFRQGPYVNLSNMRDWKELSATMESFFPRNLTLPVSWQKKVEAIRADHDSDADRAYAALRLVQNEIRYVSLAYGEGGYTPRLPEVVIESGFGDCKDKSLLLVTILDQLGIPSNVALANLSFGFGLNERLPGLYAFDHAIVKVPLHGRAVWMDPTGTHEAGGLTTASRLDYGWALPLTPEGAAEMERTDPGRKGRYEVKATESYEYTMLGVWLTVESEYDARGADVMRYSLAVDGPGEISKRFSEYQQNRYPGLQMVGEMKFEDKPDYNRLLVTERYFLPKFSMIEFGLLEDFTFGSENHLSGLSDIVGKTRKTPFVAGTPLHATLRVELKGFPLQFQPPDSLTIRNKSFIYDFRGVATRKGQMTLFFRFDRTGKVIPPEDYAGFVHDLRRYQDYLGFAWDLSQESE